MPAQVLRRHYTSEADIWSCGIILYILLSGVPPFWGETENQIFNAILKGKIDFQSDPWPLISAGAKDCVQKMLQHVCSLTSTAAANKPMNLTRPCLDTDSCGLMTVLDSGSAPYRRQP